ncbi:MAG: HAMP domain-containing sensor histidine kinase [Anaerolineae bacterium]|nr:HAMP domain-containing histidine kinase [Candidatus Roseilinea sp.]MDW8451647.1 HAMP domain-containing sensor histidine kinase [Anaerolineae bacterium]
MRTLSIRWRLVLSYALLAVLTVGVVGALALGLIRSNLAQRETELLTMNAQAVARQAARSIQPVSDRYRLQQLADMAAFLGNVQVRILDAEGNLIVDSGPRGAADRLMWIAPPSHSDAVSAARQPWIIAGVFSRRMAYPEFEARLFEALGIGEASPSAQIMVVERVSGPYGDQFVFSELRQQTSSPPTQPEEPLPATATQVRVPIELGSAVVGYVELSSASALNEATLQTAQRAFMLAALGATLLAVLAGLWVSRGLSAPLLDLTNAAARMAQGDLSARAPVRATGQSRDEIEQLAGRFNDMAAKLEASFQALSAERDALRRFIADASHELRTPITALKMANELLQGPAGEDPTTRAEFLAQNATQLARLEWITRNLLDLSRLDAGIAQLELAEHDVAELLASAARPFEQAAEQKGIRLIVYPLPLTVRCDRARVEIALSNLIENALKFTPAGGRIEVSAEAEGGNVRLLVRDTGIGVAPEDQAHIFERFYRGKNHRADGSGLGLAIVKSIAQAHGGTAFVESVTGAGSTFGIVLPLASPQPAAP